MNITIVCVGKLKERFWADAVDEYLKRLRPYARCTVVEVPDLDPAKVGGVETAKDREGQSILAAIPEKAKVYLLAIEGKLISSEDLSAELDECALEGSSDVVFVIGGSCGSSKSVYARANKKISLGRITLPHNLARVVLVEQIYRAFKISRGEPYHK